MVSLAGKQFDLAQVDPLIAGIFENPVSEKDRLKVGLIEKEALVKSLVSKAAKAKGDQEILIKNRMRTHLKEVAQMRAKLELLEQKDLTVFEKIGYMLKPLSEAPKTYEEYVQRIQYAGEGLFFNQNDFKNFDQDLLEKQIHNAKKTQLVELHAKAVENSRASIPTLQIFEPKITFQHMVAEKDMVLKLVHLLELEVERRKYPEYQEEAIIEDESPKEFAEEFPEKFEEVFTPKIKTKTPPPAAAAGVAKATAVREVELKRYVQKSFEALEEKQRLSFNDLVAFLKDNGPVLDPQVARDHGWRNFGKLTPVDYHCHLGSSDTVVVWRVLGPNQLSIYYLGRHPNSYKAILKKDIVPAAAQKP